jgi:protein-disulfide isomerase
MASRAEQKAHARAQRIEFERKLAEAEQRKQRLMRLAGVALVAVIVIVAAIVISSGGSTTAVVKPTSTAAKANVARVSALLAGIPQSGTTLGNPNASIQVTEYGDLECSACDDFALPTTANTSAAGVKGSGVEDQLINTYVKTGKASLVFRSLDTATGNGATPQQFVPQQVAAEAAGLQGKAWQYIELFYAEQGAEGSTYVDESYLDGLAKQVPGLNYTKWLADRKNTTLAAQVQTDGTAASSQNLTNTPSIIVRGPKGQVQPLQGVPSWSQLQQMITAAGG